MPKRTHHAGFVGLALTVCGVEHMLRLLVGARVPAIQNHFTIALGVGFVDVLVVGAENSKLSQCCCRA